MEFLVVLFISCFSLLSYTNSQFSNVPLQNVSVPNALPQTTIRPEIQFENYDPRTLVDQLPGYGKTWMYFPDGRGIPTVAQLDTDGVSTRNATSMKESVTFHLYTRLHPNKSVVLEYGNKSTIVNSDYDVSRPTKVVVHGWWSNYKSDTSETFKNNFLESDDLNVILVDWSNIAGNDIYPIVVTESHSVGDLIGQMVDYLVENGANMKDFHLVGHSLGAHIAGRAGYAFKSGKIGHITGLDPALPGYDDFVPKEKKLDKSDAKFVDVIHTCGGSAGIYSKLGHVDFYPNGGIPNQPGCSGTPQIMLGCSHGRAWHYYAESILFKDRFIATQCDSWEKYKIGGCRNNRRILMGPGIPNDAKGVFYLKTKRPINKLLIN